VKKTKGEVYGKCNNEVIAGIRRAFRTSDQKMESKMGKYIFGSRNKIHIIDLQKP
jgi:ribosomal protein S2